MDIEKLKNIFRTYVEKFDMNDSAILKKFYHSYRVMELCDLIANKNQFNEKDREISILVGLLHDYARFEQWAKYKTYSDIKSIDHADLAVEKLFNDNEIINYCTYKEYYSEIYDAIKYHNKIEVPENIKDHNKLICNVVRDADKLDIFYLLGTEERFCSQENEISDKIKKNFYNHRLVNRKDIQSKNDVILLYISMIYDLNFKCSFEYIKEHKLIDKIYEKIEDKYIFNEYFEYIKNYVEERIEENVRKKI